MGDPADHLPVLRAMTAPARAVADRIRAKLAEGEAAIAWRTMPSTVRALLVQLATNRPDSAAAIPWAAFTQAEQAAIGAAGRDLRRMLAACDMLR